MEAPAPFRFTRELYHRMGREGLFDGLKVELLDGEIIRMSPQDSRHAWGVHRILYAFARAMGEAFVVRAQVPIVLDDQSEPEPDIAICEPTAGDYLDEHPHASQVLLVVEVAGSSLGYDRSAKALAYARSGIRTYVIANLPDRTLEVKTEPERDAGRYARTTTLREGDDLTLPGSVRVPVSTLLPPREQ